MHVGRQDSFTAIHGLTQCNNGVPALPINCAPFFCLCVVPPSPCSRGPVEYHAPHLSLPSPYPTLWLDHLLGVLPKFLPSAQDPGHRQCSLLGNSLWLTTATSGDGRDGIGFPSPPEFEVSSSHFLFLYHIYAFFPDPNRISTLQNPLEL